MVAVIAVSFATRPSIAEEYLISIGAAGTGGTTYPMNAGIAEVLARDIPEVKNATVQVTGGSFENVRLLERGYIQLATASAVASHDSFHAKGRFKNPIEVVRSLAWAHGSQVHVVSLQTSGIQTWDDLKGKRISIGPPGSQSAGNMLKLFDVLGTSESEYNVEYLSYTEGVNALKDRRVDATVVSAGFPVASIQDLSTTHKTHIMEWSDELMDKFLAKYPIYTKGVIPGGTYQNVDKDVQVLVSNVTWITSSEVPEDLVYNMIKTVYDNIDWLSENIHHKFKMWNFDPSIQRIAPLHPGAEKFYREIGKL
jgi:TRAP transporter TAXI family solute receptor